MKKRMIAMALVIVMLFALSACGKKQESAPTAQPEAAASSAPAEAQSAEQPSAEPGAEPAAEQPEDSEVPTAVENGIPDGSGVVTKSSEMQGFSIDFDSDKYVAMENLIGNLDIFAGTDEGIPRCSVALRLKEDTEDAVSYLRSIVESVEAEKGKNIVTKAGEPKKVPYGDRDIYYVAYVYKDKDAGGNVQCAYYAENLKDGDVAVFTSSALQGQTEDVDAILNLAIQTFKFN